MEAAPVEGCFTSRRLGSAGLSAHRLVTEDAVTRRDVRRRGYGFFLGGGLLLTAFVAQIVAADDVVNINNAVVVDSTGYYSGVQVRIVNGKPLLENGEKQSGWTLQTAIDNAAYGHLFFNYSTETTITLGASLTVSKPVTIGSLGSGQVWLAGTATGARSDGLLVTAGTVRIENLGFEGFRNAIVIGPESGSSTSVTATLYKNTIGNNDHDGVQVIGANTTAYINANNIGVDAKGTARFANGWNGVTVADGATAYIGSAIAVDRNVITANGRNGVEVTGGSQATIVGNYVGLGSDGEVIVYQQSDKTYAIASNGFNGLSVTASAVTIDSNIISASGNNGIVLEDVHGASVVGNHIGTNAKGDAPAFVVYNGAPFGNSWDGIQITSSASNQIGEKVAGNMIAGNIIAFSSGNGITVGAETDANTIRANSIYGNVQLGIDVPRTGEVTPENPTGVDDRSGSQNYPTVETASSDGSNLSIHGYLDTYRDMLYPNASDLFAIDFFSNTQPGPWGPLNIGINEGQTYLGSCTLTRNDKDGHRFNFNAILSINSSLSTQRYITATATDAGGHTSEFSYASEINYNTPTVVPLPSPALMSLGGLGLLAGVQLLRGRRARK